MHPRSVTGTPPARAIASQGETSQTCSINASAACQARSVGHVPQLRVVDEVTVRTSLGTGSARRAAVRNRCSGDRDRAGPVHGRCRGGPHSPDPAARRVEHRRLDRHLAALRPAGAGLALAASFGLARSGDSVGVLAIVPFIVVPLIAALRLVPSMIIWSLAARPLPPRQVSPAGLLGGHTGRLRLSLTIFAWGPIVASKLARRRYERLNGYLSNPDHG
jgi:hypothetical protein